MVVRLTPLIPIVYTKKKEQMLLLPLQSSKIVLFDLIRDYMIIWYIVFCPTNLLCILLILLHVNCPNMKKVYNLIRNTLDFKHF